ncbi:MAG: hypothetical protein ABW168_05595 [Sedimenticola sp.]
MESVTTKQVLGSNGLVPLLYQYFMDCKYSSSIIFSAFCIIPLVLLSSVTLYEGRFYLGSIFTVDNNLGAVLGMSFLGDTMVWPFCILVPLLFVLVVRAANYASITINRLSSQTINGIENRKGKENVAAVLKKTNKLFQGNISHYRMLIKATPYLVALIFWAYNTTTCAFHNELGEKYYPYQSSRVFVITDAKGNTINQEKALDNQMLLPKWDCDKIEAPLSTWSTRLWTLVYYGLPPFLLMQLLLIIGGLSLYLKSFRNWSKEHNAKESKDQFLVKPFSHDGFGGLGYIADTGMAFFYSSFIFVLLILMSYFKEGVSPSWHNYLLMVFVLPICLYAFLSPSLIVMNTIRDAKEKYLGLLSNEANKTFYNVVCSDLLSKDPSFVYQHTQAIKTIYEQIQKMAIWPFSISTVIKIFATLLSPILALFAQEIIKHYLG